MTLATFRLDVYHHLGDADLVTALQPFFNSIEGKLDMQKADFDAVHDAITVSLNAVQAKLDELNAKVATGGMSADEEAAVMEEFKDIQAKAAALTSPPSE